MDTFLSRLLSRDKGRCSYTVFVKKKSALQSFESSANSKPVPQQFVTKVCLKKHLYIRDSAAHRHKDRSPNRQSEMSFMTLGM